MHKLTTITALVGMVLTLGGISDLRAQALSVSINGANVTTSCGTNCINIEGDYGNVHISPISTTNGAHARVEAIPTGFGEASYDYLRLINAHITATRGAVSNFPIIFSRGFTAGPSGTHKYFKLIVSGTLSPVDSNEIKAQGYYANPATAATQKAADLDLIVQCDETGCPGMVSLNGGTYFDPGTTTRLLRVETQLTLASGSTFDTSSGIKMSAPELPDEIPNTCPTCTLKAQLNTFCMTTYSTANAFGCPSCITNDGQVASHAKVKLFASTNWDNLSQDMARGQGEHLASLAALLSVPAEHQPAFFKLAQGRYVMSAGGETPEQVVASLHESWSSH